MGHYAMLHKYGKHTRDFLGLFNLYFSLVFYLLRVFLIKKNYSTHTCWIWMITANLALCVSLLNYHLIFNARSWNNYLIVLNLAALLHD